MAANSNTRAQVKELTDRLAEGVKEVFSSDKYRDYLRVMARFPAYSARNTMLIYLQNPNATMVAGFCTWQNKFGRNVKKGEKALRILAPTPFTVKKEMQKIDPDTQRPMLDAEGLPETEEVEIRIPRFKTIPVFDASQTDGKPLPTLAADIFGNVKNYDVLMEATREVSPLPVNIVPLPETTDGRCIYGEAIELRQGMSEVQTVCAAVHEITHAKLHDAILQDDDPDPPANPKSSTTKEVEAESVAYAVCQYFGIETSPNSFGYLASWSSGMELKELNASLETIRNTSVELIDGIEKKYRALAKEQGIELGEEGPAAEPVDTVDEYISDVSQLALDALVPGTEIYLDKASKPVQVVQVRESDVLFVLPEMGLDLTRTHAEVLQALQSRRENRALLQAADAGVALNEIAPLPKAEPSASEPGVEEKIVQMRSAIISSYEGMDAFVGTDDKVYIGKAANYDNKGHYDNSDNSLLYVSDNTDIFHLLSGGDGMAVSQAEAVERGIFSEEILSEFAALQAGPLAQFTQKHPFLFDGQPFVPPGDSKTPSTPLPDPSITLTARDEYGYTGPDMLPLGKNRALDLFDQEQVVYLLFKDGTEQMAFEREEIEAHDGIYGIEATEWEQTPEYATLCSAASGPAREAELLHSEGDTFAIYQLKGGDDLRYHRWMHYDELHREGLAVERANYDLVYTAPLPEGKTLADITQEFNLNHPADFTGHSLSTSDVVVLNQGGKVTSHYDDGAFVPLPAFLGEEQREETAYSQTGNTPAGYDGPSVADLEDAVERGESISLLELSKAIKHENTASDAKKPSILAQLQEHKQAAVDAVETGKAAPKHNAEREV